MYSAIISMCTYAPFQNMKMQCQNSCTDMYLAHTGTYHLMTLKYVLGTFFLSKVCTRKHTFNTKYGMYQVHTGTYLR
jgi:hypothetical protein